MAVKMATKETSSDETVNLVLALYQRYYRDGVLYTADKVYSFTPEQAAILLAESDDGRPIWRKYFPKSNDEAEKAVEATKPVVKAKESKHVEMPAKQKTIQKIELGTEDELKELNLPDEGEVVVV